MSRVPIRTEREKDIQKTILEGLSALRIWHMRTNSGAMFAEHGGKKRMLRFGRKGMADILVLFRYERDFDYDQIVQVVKPIWIEVKKPGNPQSPDQELFQSEVEAEGHRYIVAHGWEDVLEAIR